MARMKPVNAKNDAEKVAKEKKERQGKILIIGLTLVGMAVTLWMMFMLWDTAYAAEVTSAKPSAQIVGKELQTGKAFDLHALYKAEQPPKAVVLNFYSTTCVPCIREAPDFNDLTKEYQAKGVHFYYVNVESSAKLKRLESFIRRLEVIAPMVLSDGLKVRKDYNAYAMPKAVILDGAGNISYEHEGYDPTLKATLSAKLDTLLKG